MIEPVSAVNVLSPSPSDPHPESLANEVQIASGPLVQPTPADQVQFGQALKVGGFEELQASPKASGQQVWSHIKANVSHALDQMSGAERNVFQTLQGGSPDAAVADGSSTHRKIADGTEKQDGSADQMQQILDQMQDDQTKNIRMMFEMTGLTIEVDVAKNVSETTLSSLKQLTSGGG